MRRPLRPRPPATTITCPKGQVLRPGLSVLLAMCVALPARAAPVAPAEPAPAEPTHAEPTRAEAAELAPPLAAIRVAVAPLEGGGLRVVALGNDLAAPPGAAIAILVPVSEADSDFLRRELVG